MKKVLIISPHFPPMNAADMHRVRMGLPYFKQLGWDAEIICVNEKYIEGYKDYLLNKTIPPDVIVHKIKAWPVQITRLFGMGSLSLRSLWHFKKKGNELLKKNHFDLIFFSTTAFHVCWLGKYWKKKFRVPFIIDMQDPWRSDFYLDKPKSERPPKFFISYNIDKYLESKTLPDANCIVSVSEGYCEILMQRYPLKINQFQVITFGGSKNDFKIMEENITHSSTVSLSPNTINFVYIGRGGYDLGFALRIIFAAFKKGLKSDFATFANVHFYFIGTSYATEGLGVKTILPLAAEFGLETYVTEITDRIPFFETLFLLKKADILLVPGSTDGSYTASKIYPYILAEKQLIAVFNRQSSVINVLQNLKYENIVEFDPKGLPETYTNECYKCLVRVITTKERNIKVDSALFEPYSASEKTKELIHFFNKVIAN